MASMRLEDNQTFPLAVLWVSSVTKIASEKKNNVAGQSAHSER